MNWRFTIIIFCSSTAYVVNSPRRPRRRTTSTSAQDARAHETRDHHGTILHRSRQSVLPEQTAATIAARETAANAAAALAAIPPEDREPAGNHPYRVIFSTN